MGFAGEKTLAGNAGDEVLGDLHAVTGLGEFVAQMLRAPGPGILQAISNEANAERLDESNQLIDFSTFVCGSSANAIAAVSSSVKIEARSWRMRSTVGFGSQLSTRTLLRFQPPLGLILHCDDFIRLGEVRKLWVSRSCQCQGCFSLGLRRCLARLQ